jgi:hypothetical protein
MRAIARLTYLYFFGAGGLRWLSGGGLISLTACAFLWRWRPDWLPAILFGWSGLAALFIGTALMPMMMARTAGGHWGVTVPYLRIKLLASALLTVLLVSMPVLVLMYAGVGQTAASHLRPLDSKLVGAAYAANVKLMWIAFLVAANLLTWLYLVAWLVTSRRTAWGLFRALLVLSLILYAPVRDITTLDASLRANLTQLGVTWAAFAILFLTWPRWRTLGRLRVAEQSALRTLLRPRTAGRVIDLLLGTSHPWVMAAALALPTLLAIRISSYVPGAWLYCLVLFSTSSAAIAGQASGRSRTLWLRGGWSRVELFREAERSFWRHNFIVLAVLLVVMVAVGTYVNLAPQLMALGIPLLVLGTALGTYLGLMVTRGVGWQEATLAILVMLSLMAGALIASRVDLSKVTDVARLILLGVALVAAAVTFRFLSLRRWEHIDWTASRCERAIRARMAS